MSDMAKVRRNEAKFWANGCARKKRHATEALALIAAEYTNKKYGPGISSYYCPGCDGFHVGHTNESKQ
jgi:hypothetical protein